MPLPIHMEKVDAIISKADAVVQRFDSFMAKKRIKQDEDRKRMADARIAKANKKMDALKAKKDAFEEARHPRNANGIFATGEGEEGKEKTDTQIEHGSLSKRNLEAT